MEHYFGICNLSVVPVRAEASDKSEQVNQLLFGDRVRIINRAESWLLVQGLQDHYMGWIDAKQCVEVALEEVAEWDDSPYVAGPLPVNLLLKTSRGQSVQLVPGSSFPVGSSAKFTLNGEIYQAPDGLWSGKQGSFRDEVAAAAQFYLNSPYQWGGRSPYGIDCSGFTQVVFKIFGIPLKRDASQQASQGDVVHFLTEALPGDLAFFDNAEGKIIHVGILLSNSEIIHASGRVKIDPIDAQGIYSEDLGRHTHKLRIIRRFAH